MIKVADIYVSEDGCGPYTVTVCGGTDASYFKVIGKSLYFDENKFSSLSPTSTSSTTTTINPSFINMFITAGPYNSYVYGFNPKFSFSIVSIVVYENGQLISNPQLSYQWQELVSGTWVNIPNATGSSLNNYTKSNSVRASITYKNKTIFSSSVRGYASIV